LELGLAIETRLGRRTRHFIVVAHGLQAMLVEQKLRIDLKRHGLYRLAVRVDRVTMDTLQEAPLTPFDRPVACLFSTRRKLALEHETFDFECKQCRVYFYAGQRDFVGLTAAL
jgi:hypothetical protein